MANEIERKFLLSSIPSRIDLTSKVTYERYFLNVGPGEELRIQRKDDKYFSEQKVTQDRLSSSKKVTPITIEKFNELRQHAIASIERDSYVVPDTKNTTIKVYHGRFEGLIRLEIEFRSTEEAIHFLPPDWSGVEITESDIGRDSKLVSLSDPEFRTLLTSASDPKPS